MVVFALPIKMSIRSFICVKSMEIVRCYRSVPFVIVHLVICLDFSDASQFVSYLLPFLYCV